LEAKKAAFSPLVEQKWSRAVPLNQRVEGSITASSIFEPAVQTLVTLTVSIHVHAVIFTKSKLTQMGNGVALP